MSGAVSIPIDDERGTLPPKSVSANNIELTKTTSRENGAEGDGLFRTMEDPPPSSAEDSSSGTFRSSQNRLLATSSDESNENGINGHTQNGNNAEEGDEEIPSNEKLLGIAFVSFISFALFQLFFAFVAGSEAMKGDSAAMIVDSLTYFFNWIAERRKNRFDEAHPEMVYSTMDAETARRIRKRQKRKLVLRMEIIPPLISVLTLIVVTFFVVRKAIKVLILDMHRPRSEQLIPNVNLMLFFSILNLGLDFVNVFCFAKAKHLTGYDTVDHGHHHGQHHAPSVDVASNGELPTGLTSSATSSTGYRQVQLDGSEGAEEDEEAPPTSPLPMTNEEAENGHARDVMHAAVNESEEADETNLNMCSAYTHVFADTLRSIAVILAACLAEIIDDVSPEVADSTAAVVVSVLILLSLIPLFQGLVKSISELRSIQAEERSDEMLRQSQQEERTIT